MLTLPGCPLTEIDRMVLAELPTMLKGGPAGDSLPQVDPPLPRSVIGEKGNRPEPPDASFKIRGVALNVYVNGVLEVPDPLWTTPKAWRLTKVTPFAGIQTLDGSDVEQIDDGAQVMVGAFVWVASTFVAMIDVLDAVVLPAEQD